MFMQPPRGERPLLAMALVGNAGQPFQEDRLRSPPVRSAEVDASIYAQVVGQDMLESAA
jgi:hypothetical protein